MTQSIYSFVAGVSAKPEEFKCVEYEKGKPIQRVTDQQRLFHISMVVRQSNLGAMSEYLYCSIPSEISGGRFYEYLTPVTQIKNKGGELPVNLPVLKFGADGKLYLGLDKTVTNYPVVVTVTKLL